MSLIVPSGLKLSEVGLFRQVADLTPKDLDFVFNSARGKRFRKPIRELLGKGFARRYSARRQAITGKHLDFWTLNKGKYRAKFCETAVEAKRHGLNLDFLIYCAEDITRAKKFVAYPTPYLVCGPYVFAQVLNGWLPSGYESPPAPDESDHIEPQDAGQTSWIWQPGYHWDKAAGMFVKTNASD